MQSMVGQAFTFTLGHRGSVAISHHPQSLKSVQVPKDKLSKVSKLKEISKDGYSGEPSPRQGYAYPFNFHLPSWLLIIGRGWPLT